jgi:hypothetical protein
MNIRKIDRVNNHMLVKQIFQIKFKQKEKSVWDFKTFFI